MSGSSHWSRYVAKAFNARPLGMPIPPNWFGVAAIALLGGFLGPVWWLGGLAAEAAYLAAVAGHPRFRAVVDGLAAAARAPIAADPRTTLGRDELSRQAELEARCNEIAAQLERLGAGPEHIRGAAQLAALHLRLLQVRGAVAPVARTGERERAGLNQRRDELGRRLAQPSLGAELIESLTDQLAVIERRLAAHAEAARRLELVDAELERIRQQAELVHEQALLATSAAGVGRSVDALATYLEESNRWLNDQQELMGEIDALAADVVTPPARRKSGETQ